MKLNYEAVPDLYMCLYAIRVCKKLKCKFKFTVHKFLNPQAEEKWPVISSFEKLHCVVSCFSIYKPGLRAEENKDKPLYKLRFNVLFSNHLFNRSISLTYSRSRIYRHSGANNTDPARHKK